MASPDAPDASEAGVGVRVLLPDGGQMEPPEEAGEGDDAGNGAGDDDASEAVEAVDEEDEGPSTAAESGDGAPTGEEGAAEAGSEAEPAAEAGDGAESQVEAEDEAGAEEGEETGADEDEAAESEHGRAVSDEGARLLHLNVDGVFLDLLGLEVDLDTVTLDLTAVTGESKLLGNLLSAVSGLLGGDPLSDLLPENPLGGLFGGDGEGEDAGVTPSMPEVSPMERATGLAASIADAIRGAVDEAGSSIVSALPLEELLAEFLQALVDQLLESADGDGEAEEAAAST